MVKTIVMTDDFNKVYTMILYDTYSKEVTWIEPTSQITKVECQNEMEFKILDIIHYENEISKVTIDTSNDNIVIDNDNNVFKCEVFNFEPYLIELDNNRMLLDKSKFMIRPDALYERND